MTDATLNYDAVLSMSAPESSRITTTVSPSNGGPYVTNSKISLDIPATAFLNPHSSYIQFNYTPSALVKNNLVNTSIGHMIVDGGATSLFSRVALYAGQGGAEISSTNDFDFVCQSLIKRKGKVFVEQVGVNALGTHPLVTEFVANDSATDQYFLLAQNGAVPSFNFHNANAIAASATAIQGPVIKLAIPLSLFSGLFDVSRKIPLMYMGTSTVLRLELTVNTPERALYVARNNDINTYGTNVDFGFKLEQVEAQLNVSNVGEASSMIVKNSINSSGVHMKYTNVTSSSDTWPSGDTFNHKHSKSLLSLNQVVVQLRDNATLNNIFFPSVTCMRRLGLKELQVSIGPASYPQHPLSLDSASYNGNAYLENYVANDNPNKSLYGGSDSFYVSSYHAPNKSGFEVGINFSSEEDKSSYVFSGKDLRSGSNSIITRLRRDISAPAVINVNVIYFAAQSLALMKNGLVPPNLG